MSWGIKKKNFGSLGEKKVIAVKTKHLESLKMQNTD